MKLYKIKELAEILSIHEQTVRRLMRRGEIKGTRTGRLWRITEEEIKRVLGLQESQHQGTGERT